MYTRIRLDARLLSYTTLHQLMSGENDKQSGMRRNCKSKESKWPPRGTSLAMHIVRPGVCQLLKPGVRSSDFLRPRHGLCDSMCSYTD